MDDPKTYIWKEGKDQILKRMVNAYRRNKRKKKIEKLQSRENHWKGLQ
tara:strand:+ start:105 stop:248 length:144 start_codon:yes stop_codon:yes gene_type:complete